MCRGVSRSGAFGCDVRRRRDGERKPMRGGGGGGYLASEAAAPTACSDFDALRAATAACPRACVAFTAAWCAPCVRFHPTFCHLSASFADVAFVTVDVDAMDDASLDRLGVETVPTFLLVRRGVEVARLTGVAHKRPARPLAAAIRKHLLG